uniref:Uncharacterized protein n=1 Tax=Pyramimonas obovata TaxID=1411642 RepID=A0A7S0MU94_9CHLO|mmetsp:Transcript_13596/g.28966  ORF Transcript_13596/g.28966 Transcript_13596/m.28966 type:complete len:360 (+) Transcript_13596:97-1176(+)
MDRGVVAGGFERQNIATFNRCPLLFRKAVFVRFVNRSHRGGLGRRGLRSLTRHSRGRVSAAPCAAAPSSRPSSNHEGLGEAQLIYTVAAETFPSPPRRTIPIDLLASGCVVAIVAGCAATLFVLLVKALRELIHACQSASRASIQVELAAQSIVKACAAVEETCQSVDRNISRAEVLGEQASDVAERFRDLPSTASRTLLQLIQEEEDDAGPIRLGATVPGKMSLIGWLPKGRTGPRLTFSSRNIFSPGEYVAVPGEKQEASGYRSYTWGIVDFDSPDVADTCPWPPPQSFDEGKAEQTSRLSFPWEYEEQTYRVIVSLDANEGVYQTLRARAIGKRVSSIGQTLISKLDDTMAKIDVG